MKFTFVQVDDLVSVYVEPACKKLPSQLICTIHEPFEANPVIRWHLPFGMAGTLTMLTKFKTWKAERE